MKHGDGVDHMAIDEDSEEEDKKVFLIRQKN